MVLFALFIATIAAYAREVTPVAGNGEKGYSGDGGPAVLAQLDASGIAIDRLGNLFIADAQNNRIRKVDASGVITTVVGTGAGGYSGDGGLATQARLNTPSDVFVDHAGNLFIADRFNHRIRKVDVSGVITTVVGTGVEGYFGDGGLATRAQLSLPAGIFVDKEGDLFIADTYNFRIRKVDTSNVISTVAGTGVKGYSGDGGLATQAHLDNPRGLFLSASSELFIADTKNHRIRKVDASGVITTVAGTGVKGYSGDGGLATEAQLSNPKDVYIDRQGRLFIADRDNNRVRIVDIRGKIFSLVGPDFRDGSATRHYPVAVAVDANDNIYFLDNVQQRILKTASLSGAYAIRLHGTQRYLQDVGGACRVSMWDGSLFKPDGLQFVWNIVSQGGIISIQNASSWKFADNSGQSRLGMSENAIGRFSLMHAGDDAYFIAENEGTRTLIVDAHDDITLSTLDHDQDAGKWDLVRVGPLQKARITTAQAANPEELDGKQVVLGFEGYMYRSYHEGYGDYRAGFRWLENHRGWLAASDSSRVYSENAVFVVEYVGTWEEILGQQNEYALCCGADSANVDAGAGGIVDTDKAISPNVYLLKTKDGAYLQPDGITTLPINRAGDPNRPIVHLSVGEQPGIHPDYDDGTPERDKAALFLIAKDDRGVHLSAVSHQWRQPPSLVAEIKNFDGFLPVWGMVAPLNLYTLQASHNMHASKPWPEEYGPPEEHWLAAYPLGASIPLDEGILGYSKPHPGPDHFQTQLCFTNNTQKNREYNPYLGITTGWRYWFDVHPGSQVNLYVLEDDRPVDGDESNQALLR